MEVTGWCPLGVHPVLTDDAIFEALTAAVFQARFRPAIVQSRWPAIRTAFADFDLTTVAMWPEDRVPGLMGAPGMIRNSKKILATLRNARELAALRKGHGTLRAYLEGLGPGEGPLVETVDSWAHYIGAPSIRWWLRCLGLVRTSFPGPFSMNGEGEQVPAAFRPVQGDDINRYLSHIKQGTCGCYRPERGEIRPGRVLPRSIHGEGAGG